MTGVPTCERNFAVAVAAAEAVAGALDPERVAEVASRLRLHGRLERIDGEPPTIIDAAHNPDGAVALAEALPGVAAGGPVFAAVALLADKDASGFFAALAPAIEAVVATEVSAERLARGGRPGAESRSAADVASAAAAAGVEPVEVVSEAGEAVARARAMARDGEGVLLVTGSHYLIGYARE